MNLRDMNLREARCCFNCTHAENEYAWSVCDLDQDQTVYWHQICDKFEPRIGIE
ncbi:MAG: hypothetical protein PHF86_12605 [Candidatus Nanoarchaeia archaeon]|nr:hypothetical protein [Candidatus Nanoarchaeia archaeon]